MIPSVPTCMRSIACASSHAPSVCRRPIQCRSVQERISARRDWHDPVVRYSMPYVSPVGARGFLRCRSYVTVRQFSSVVGKETSASPAEETSNSETNAVKSDVPPSTRNLSIYALHCALPMIGFGFMDNLVMIQVGEVIDSSIGVTFGFATMTSAALGQVCSDVSGVCFGGVVDAFFARLGLPRYFIPAAQLLSQRVRIVRTSAMALGVASGCLLGMTSLLFMDLDKADRLKKQKELKTIFKMVAEKGGELMKCERVGLYIIDKDGEHLWTLGRKWTSSAAVGVLEKQRQPTSQQIASVLRSLQWSDQEINDVLPDGQLSAEDANKFLQDILGKDETRIPLRPYGTKWACVKEKRILNIADVGQDTRFSRSQTVKMMPTAWRSESTLVGPVIDADGEVCGVVEMINRLDEKKRVRSFSSDDERLMEMLCHHCSLFLSNVEFD